MNNILVTTYWSYKEPLIQTYTLPYVRMIKEQLGKQGYVFLFTMEQEALSMHRDDWAEECNKLKEEGIILLRSKYYPFGMKMALNFALVFLRLFMLTITKHISTIHAWCTPGGVIGYIISMLTFKPLIIDSYEPHAESMVENGEWSRNSRPFKILFWFEKQMSKKANTVIALTQGMRNYAIDKYEATFKNYYVKPALVDLDKFNFNIPKDPELIEKYKLKEKIVCIYAGKLGGIYLDKEVFDLFGAMYQYWGDKLCVLLLTSKDQKYLNQEKQRIQIPNGIIYSAYADFSEIDKYYILADFAINPVKPVPSKRYCTSIKDGEYWAMGLPVIIPQNISDDSNIIKDNNIGAVLEDLSADSYFKAIKKIDVLIHTNKQELKKRIRNISTKYRNLTIAKEIYNQIY